MTYVCIHETITTFKIMNISIIPQSFLVPLCGGGASLDTISFHENLSEEVIFELNDKKEPFKESEFHAGSWDAHTENDHSDSCTMWGEEWHNHVGPWKPEWEFRFYCKHSRKSLKGTI